MYRTHLTVLSAVALLLLPLSSVGCGGGDEAAEAALTKAQFRKKADLICAAAAEEQFKRAGIYLSKHPGVSELALVEPAGIPPLENELMELADLPAPQGQEEDVMDFTKELEKALQVMKEDPETALNTTNSPFDEANTLARHLRMGDCSRHP